MRKLLLGLIAAIAAPACANAAPPSGLYGKSVIVSWTETRSQRNPGDQVLAVARALRRAHVAESRTGRAGRCERATARRHEVEALGLAPVVDQECHAINLIREP